MPLGPKDGRGKRRRTREEEEDNGRRKDLVWLGVWGSFQCWQLANLLPSTHLRPAGWQCSISEKVEEEEEERRISKTRFSYFEKKKQSR